MKKVVLVLLLGLFPALVFSTHIIGGSLTYEQLDDSTYTVNLSLYRTCSGGTASFPPTVTIEVRSNDGTTAYPDIVIPYTSSSLVPVDSCRGITGLCMERSIYSKTINYLHSGVGGYHLYFQYCCRSASTMNIVSPLTMGETWYVHVPDLGAGVINNSPAWLNPAPVFVCQASPMLVDHSAVDAEGDSLSYSFYTPYSDQSPTFPGNVFTTSTVAWASGYGLTNPLVAGAPGSLTISAGGIINGVPTTLGQFVTGVRCEEWRAGVKIGEILRDFQFNVINCPAAPDCGVWPGDADNNFEVNNNDLLQIGLFYGQTGGARATISNSWQQYSALDWGVLETNGSDIKHADCNGDGTIDDNDTLAINMNFMQLHAIAPYVATERTANPDLYFSTSASTYLPGDYVDVDVMVGTAGMPVVDLYGLAFTIDYDASLVQSGTESLNYPMSWLGNPGTDAIKFARIDGAGAAYGSETRIDHTNRDGFGKIATFRFQTNASISTATTMNFSFAAYTANDSSGTIMVLNDSTHTIVIDPSATAIANVENTSAINIYPNPYSGSTTISYVLTENSDVRIDVYNAVGQKVQNIVSGEQQAGEHKFNFSAKKSGMDAGVYFVRISINGKSEMKRIVEMK